MYMNTKQLANALTGKNKAFITRVANHQEKKYGNEDIFSCSIHQTANVRGNCITISFGDYWIEFYFDRAGEIYDTYGNGQGHKYHKNLESCAIELNRKYQLAG